MSLHILNHNMVQPIFNLTNTLGASINNPFNNDYSQIKTVPLKIQSKKTSNFSSEYHEDKESSSSSRFS